MRFHSSGAGDMVVTMHKSDGYQQTVNNAVKHCPKCMHFIDGKVTLSLSREDDVIIAYIRDPHNAHWSVRDEQDRQRAEWEALTREAKPWRRNFSKAARKVVDSTAVAVRERPVNEQAESLLQSIRGLV